MPAKGPLIFRKGVFDGRKSLFFAEIDLSPTGASLGKAEEALQMRGPGECQGFMADSQPSRFSYLSGQIFSTR